MGPSADWVMDGEAWAIFDCLGPVVVVRVIDVILEAMVRVVAVLTDMLSLHILSEIDSPQNADRLGILERPLSGQSGYSRSSKPVDRREFLAQCFR